MQPPPRLGRLEARDILEQQEGRQRRRVGALEHVEQVEQRRRAAVARAELQALPRVRLARRREEPEAAAAARELRVRQRDDVGAGQRRGRRVVAVHAQRAVVDVVRADEGVWYVAAA